MRKKALALGVIIIVVVSVAYVAWFVQNQLTILKNENSYLQAENSDLLDQNRNLLYENKAHGELVEQLRNLTEQLALERPIRIEIVAFTHEDQWSYGTFLGVERASMKFNVTVRNNDVVAFSGLDLSVSTFSGFRRVGYGGHSIVDLLLAGGEHTMNGSLTVSFGEPTTDLSLLATLKSGDVVVDELRLSDIASPF